MVVPRIDLALGYDRIIHDPRESCRGEGSHGTRLVEILLSDRFVARI